MPNLYIDELQKTLTPYEFAVLVLIRRETEGFGKRKRRISQNYIGRKAGLPRSTVQKALRSLRDKGHIVRTSESDHWKADEWMLDQSCTIEVDRHTVNLPEDMPPHGQPMSPDGQPMTATRSSINKDICKENLIDTMGDSFQIWQQILEHLKNISDPRRIDQDFAGSGIISIEDSHIVITGKDYHLPAWIERDATRQKIEDAIEFVLGKKMSVSFEARGDEHVGRVGS
jgi:hypothetical protein